MCPGNLGNLLEKIAIAPRRVRRDKKITKRKRNVCTNFYCHSRTKYMAGCHTIQNDILHVRSISQCITIYDTPRRRDRWPILSSRSYAHPQHVSVNRGQLNFAFFIYPSLIPNKERFQICVAWILKSLILRYKVRRRKNNM